LRADSIGEANRYGRIAQAQKRRKDEEPQGRCHQLSGCVSCTRPVPRRLRPSTDHASPALRCQQGNGGRQAFGPPGGLSLALRLQQRTLPKTEGLFGRSVRLGALDDQEMHLASSLGMKASEVVAQPLSTPTSVGVPTIASAFRRTRMEFATMGSRQFDLASGRSMRHTTPTSVGRVSSA
jgi:hypothetical protein